MSTVGPNPVLFVVFLCSGFGSPLSTFFCFIKWFVIICVSLWCFTDEVEDLHADRTYVCNLEIHESYGRGFVRVKVFDAPYTLHPTPSPLLFSYSVPESCSCVGDYICASELWARFRTSNIVWSSFYTPSPNPHPIPPPPRLCYVIVAFPVYLHLYIYDTRMSQHMAKPTKRHVCPVWSEFAVRMKKAGVLCYPLSAQPRLWSDWADA